MTKKNRHSITRGIKANDGTFVVMKSYKQNIANGIIAYGNTVLNRLFAI